MAASSERLRFSNAEEIILLREAVAINPFQHPDQWSTLAENVGRGTNKAFSRRTVKNHLIGMLKKWNTAERANRGRSGVEPPLTEFTLLLQELSDLYTSFPETGRVAVRNVERRLGEEAREEAVNFLRRAQFEGGEEGSATNEVPIEVILSTPHVEDTVNAEVIQTENGNEREVQNAVVTPNFSFARRRKVNDSLRLVEDRENARIQLEKKKIKLEEEKLGFEREKFDFEKQERERKLKIEEAKLEIELLDRRQALRINECHVNMLQSQMNVIEQLLKRSN
ncbi:hypothetical protein R5R35_013830 [Gryllus longicercus]|uniref:Uncharacterized protein n=1 Tax=Gryllus longicercus TaxID=2509291 RepID=A0AAN9VRG0_9ORTH